MNPEDARLKALLRKSRLSPPLPPRFRENVWRRIEGAEAPATMNAAGWIEGFVVTLLRPRFAYATVAILMVVGILLGVHEGTQSARAQAEARYVSEVAPDLLR